MSAIVFDGIGKTFPGVVALDAVSFAVYPGEVRALMGENGAGKSTLLKILGGEYRPDCGTLSVGDGPCVFAGPRESRSAGIAIIHQELQLAPNLSVAENLTLGEMPRRGLLLDRSAMRRVAGEVMARLGEAIDPDTPVSELSIGKRQMVEIAKALLRDARVIAFDEPTSSLSARETETLKRIVRELAAQGRAILYVSHRMEEVLELADSVTVLRDGRHVADFHDVRALTQESLIAAMAGRAISDIYGYRPRALGERVLTLDRVIGPGLASPVSLTARKHEILGFFGLVGAGRTELFRLIFGATRVVGGGIAIRGASLDPGNPRAAIRRGVALLPEDRKDEGIVPLASVRENIALARRNLRGSPIIDRAGELGRAQALIESLRIRTASADTPIGTLSGGNQQKAIIARWLAAEADILLFDEPTRGIDVAARSDIYAQMYRLAGAGATILMASSDLPEVMGVADRIVVMRGGVVAGIVERGAESPETLLRMALPDANGRATAPEGPQ